MRRSATTGYCQGPIPTDGEAQYREFLFLAPESERRLRSQSLLRMLPVDAGRRARDGGKHPYGQEVGCAEVTDETCSDKARQAQHVQA